MLRNPNYSSVAARNPNSSTVPSSKVLHESGVNTKGNT